MNKKDLRSLILTMFLLISVMILGIFGCANPEILVNEEKPSDNANLSSLSISYKEYIVDNSGDTKVETKKLVMSPAFDKDVLTYNVDLSYDTDVLLIKPVLEDGKSSIKINNQSVKNDKDNSVIIKRNSLTVTLIKIDVTAQNGTEKSYSVTLKIKIPTTTTTTLGNGGTTETTISNGSSTTTLANGVTTTISNGNVTTTSTGNVTTTNGNGVTTTNGNNPSTTVVITIPVTTTSSTAGTTIPTTTTTTIPYDGVIIYYKSTSADPTIWAWELDGKAVMTQINPLYAWPGPKMTAVAGKTNWYKFEIPSTAMSNPIKELHMKFKGEGTEYKREVPVKTGWLSGSTWTDDCPDLPQKPTISISPV
ncbi:MAG TPA: hypothetical protein PK771_12900, partial [Spirochaetota bacterium]|nr:hypothetical protein [Spirochaetota bacterium]